MANPGSLTILIVDDDPMFREVLSRCLSDHGYAVVCAENGLQAQQLIGVEFYHAVISDVRMPDIHGIQLLKWIKENHPRLPVILMTGFSELLETTEAAQVGATGFLAKPFKRDEVFSLLESALAVQSDQFGTEEEGDRDDDFCRIRIEDFISGSDIRHDIFVRISSRKYVKIAHSGQDLDSARVKIYQSKNIDYLYLRKEDFKQYVGFNLELARRVSVNKKFELSRKIGVLRQAGEVVMNSLFRNTMDSDSFQHAKSMVDTALGVLGDSDETLGLLQALNNHSDYLFAHSIGVSMYGSMISKNLGWRSPISVFKVSYSALLHDIGKKEIPLEILMKPRLSRTAEDIRLIETHPLRGMEILRKVPGLPDEVIQVVYQHHENCIGTGYPAHLRKAKISPVARVVAVADEFCRLVMKGPDGPGMAPEEAIASLRIAGREAYESDVLDALAKVFRLESGSRSRSA